MMTKVGLASEGEEMVEEPKDAYNLTYTIHFLLGIANLLPWNTFITAVDYFSFLYPKEHVDKAFAVAYMASSLLVLLALICTRNWSKRPSVRSRITAGLCLFVSSLLVSPLLDLLARRHHPGQASRPYGVMVSALVICGVADGLVGGTLIGSTGELPKRYMQAVFVGTASSGVLVSILRIITKASLPQNPKGLRTSTRVYFSVSIAIIVGCVVCYNILYKLPVMQHYYKPRPRAPHPPGQLCSVPPNEHLGGGGGGGDSEEIINMQPKFWDVFKKIRWPACGVSLIYVVTLSIFPGYITEDVRSELLRDWYPILLIASYNVSDLAGKSLTGAYVPDGTKGATWGCVVRLIFYPLFYACLHGPKFFRTEVPVIFLTCLLGLTNGYLTSAVMILVPKSVPQMESETAGTVMMTFLAIGLLMGSLVGWLWVI